MSKARLALVAAVAVILCTRGSVTAQGGSQFGELEFREITETGIAQEGTSIPKEAVQVFVYEGKPHAARVTNEQIAVDYGQSGVVFDHKTEKALRRLTIADGWPGKRSKEFPQRRRQRRGQRRRTMVGPGVLRIFHSPSPRAERPQYDVGASVEFGGYAWTATQPRDFLGSLGKRAGNDYKKMREIYGSWTGILRELNAESFLLAEPTSGNGETVRYTMKEGLASNIVTHLAVAEGKLWAACVDIYDYEKKQWGPGGLCCFDQRTGRWERIGKIDGHTVRWVTLLERTDEGLWVGFRGGTGVTGDKVAYGMGSYPRQYRPQTSAVVLAKLSGEGWSTFPRAPLPGTENDPPRETPRTLAVLGEQVFLLSETQARASGNWDVPMDGHISQLDLKDGRWRLFDVADDFAAFHLSDMIAEDGEILAFTNRGAHRWSGQEEKWRFLDPQSPIRNPNIFTAVSVGNELWIGYTNQSFGVIGQQGISRFNEEAGQWSYTPPKEIGTACPVRNMVVMPDGDVWVLFRKWEWRYAAMEFAYYPEQAWDARAGLGRFSGGKWGFPIKLDGVPESRERERKGPDGIRTWTEKLPIRQMAAVGTDLFVANAAGVYMGPGRWRQICKAEGSHYGGPGSVLGIEASEDRRALVIWQLARDGKLQRGLYDVASGELAFSTITDPKHDDYQRIHDSGYLLSGWGDRGGRGRWMRVPTRKQGDWAVGPLGSAPYAVVETPWAVWIASRGELIRLDRKHLAAWFVSGDD